MLDSVGLGRGMPRTRESNVMYHFVNCDLSCCNTVNICIFFVILFIPRFYIVDPASLNKYLCMYIIICPIVMELGALFKNLEECGGPGGARHELSCHLRIRITLQDDVPAVTCTAPLSRSSLNAD